MDNFSLKHLLNYIDFMDKVRLKKFIEALKCKVLDKIEEFDPAYIEELDVLCQLTDESLTKNGQKIITKRMLTIVNRTSFMKNEKSDCVLIDNPQHNITQEELSLESLFHCRISGNLDSQSESEIKSFSIDRSANIYKSHEKQAILGTLKGVKKNLRKIPDNIEGYDSSFSINGCISAVENENIKKEMPDSIKSCNSIFSINDCIGTGKNGNIKREIPENIEGYNSSFYTNDCSSAGENGNTKKEMQDNIEGCSSFCTNGCVNASGNRNSDNKGRRNISSNYAANNKHLFHVWNRPRNKIYNKWETSSTEFVNRNKKKFPLKVNKNPSSVDDSTFSHSPLNNFLNYDVPSNDPKNFKCGEVKSFESCNVERYTISNNEKKYVKIKNSNENIDTYEQRSDKNQKFNSKEKRNESSNLAIHSMQRYFSDIGNEPGSNRSNGWRPNVKAEEFIPRKTKKLPSKMDMCPSSLDNSTFGHFSLIDLLNYDVDLMPSEEFNNYANCLKSRVLDGILTFEPSDKEEIKILCKLLDDNPTDSNTKIICSRLCALVNRTIPNKQRSHKFSRRIPSPRYHQQTNYGN